MFLYLITCFLRVAVSLLYRLQAVSKIHVPIYPYLISEERRNYYSNKTVTLRKHATKYEKCENGRSNIAKNLRIVALKLLELTRLSPNLSIYSYLH